MKKIQLCAILLFTLYFMGCKNSAADAAAAAAATADSLVAEAKKDSLMAAAIQDSLMMAARDTMKMDTIKKQ